MTNLDRLKTAFSEALQIESNQIVDGLTYQSIPEWDSISHMILISEIESQFDISLETDDVIDLSSFLKSKEILKKYGVEI